MMRKLLGPHLGGRWANKLDILRKWQPPLALLLQPEVDKVKQLRDACPGTVIVGRFYHDDNHYSDNIRTRPEDFAREIHNEIVSNPVTPLLDYVQSNNETNQNWDGIQRLNQFTQTWMALADESQAYKCAILAFSVGNPDMPNKPGDPSGFDGRMLYWQRVLPSLNYAQRNGHILLLHSYGYPDMFHPDADWYIYRYERQVQARLQKLGITNLKYAYGEIGIDRLLVGSKGGYRGSTNDRDYTNQLLQWERYLQGQDLLIGGAIFTFGDSGGWGDYDIASTDVASMLAAHYADNGGEYTNLGAAGGESVTNTVHLPFASSGRTPAAMPAMPERDWDSRLDARGVSIVPVDVAPGKQFWRIAKARWWDEAEAGGRHHIYVEAPAGQAFRVEWPSGQSGAQANGKAGFDAGNFALSASLNEFSVRMASDIPSETLAGIGMGADGNSGIHTATGVTFQLVTMPASTQPAPPVDTGTPAQPLTPIVPHLTHPIANPAARIISQRFGENPQDYARFGLAGHAGVDYAVPSGTPILAVDSGEAVELGDDSNYGIYVKLRHSWGESLYAHLRLGLNLDVGNAVGKGQIIGTSGNTGNSTGPHLHFAMRVNPYQRGAPYDGYTDPLPHLGAVERPGDVLGAIRQAATEFGVEYELLASLAWAESSFNPHAVSSAGATGLMQLMEGTWQEWRMRVGASNILDALDNARVGAAYLAWLLKHFGGDARKALISYVWGVGNVSSGRTPPQEATEYASKVLHGRDLLRAVGGR